MKAPISKTLIHLKSMLTTEIASAMLGCLQLTFEAIGIVEKFEVIIYKVDRMGDWILVHRTISEIIENTANQSVLTIASQESHGIRELYPIDGRFEEIAFSPNMLQSRIRRFLKALYILSRYRCERLICLRYEGTPFQSFFLDNVICSQRSLYPESGTREPVVPAELLRHQRVLRSIGIYRTITELLPKLKNDGEKLSSSLIVLSPFGSSSVRNWSKEKWANLFDRVLCVPTVIEIWVAQTQRTEAADLAVFISSRVALAECRVASGSLFELRQAISKAGLVISVETMTAHLAASLDARLVCLMGGGHYGEFAPWARSSRQAWIVNKLPCFGCNWKCALPSVECMLGISVEDVAKAFVALFSQEEVDRVGGKLEGF